LPTPASEQEKIDIAFRVIADHIRTLSFAIADGIIPSNEGRGYVLRRILRRAVRYGRSLGFHQPFFYKLVAVLAETMGHVFSEIRSKQKHVEEVIQREEEAFTNTLDKGLELFESVVRTGECLQANTVQISQIVDRLSSALDSLPDNYSAGNHRFAQMTEDIERLSHITDPLLPNTPVWAASRIGTFSTFLLAFDRGVSSEKTYGEFLKKYPRLLEAAKEGIAEAKSWEPGEIGGREAFLLYDTYGFPLDLTELMARERGLSVDVAGFQKFMEEQKARARAAQKRTEITLQDGVDLVAFTDFLGYDKVEAPARVLNVIPQGNHWAVVLNESPFYAEMGGQVGDTGTISAGANLWPVLDTKKVHLTWLHIIAGEEPPPRGTNVTAAVDVTRRFAIQRHHTVTHLLHWALHEVVSPDAVQKGSYVGPDKLTFDFSSAPLSPQQVTDVERLVNERILENAPVSWTEVKYSHIKDRKDVMQFFGEKYGDWVRVVQIGGKAASLDGYSMELCGGTHTRATGELGLFRIVAESAIAAGIRRIEAISGLEAYRRANEELQLIKTLSGKVNSPVGELEKKIESLLAQQKELEKQLKTAQQKQAAEIARGLLAKARTIGSTPAIVENLGAGDGDFLQSVADGLKGQFKGVVVLGAVAGGAVALVATVSPEFTKQVQAGKIIQTIAPLVGGKGGGRPDNARGGGKDVARIEEALAKTSELLP
jgi:alanyl-tRNA synthetase